MTTLEPAQPLVQINLYPQCTTLTRRDGDTVQTYIVADKTVADLFAPARSIATGFIPQHILAWGVDAQETEWVVAYFKPAVREIILRDGRQTERLTLPFPGCVLRGRGRSYAIWAVKRRPQNANALLYRFPAPNVYSDGAICTGNASFPQASITTIDKAVETFFASAFNDHLAGTVIHGGKLFDLWRALANKQAPAQVPEPNAKRCKIVAQRFPTHRLIYAGRLKEIF